MAEIIGTIWNDTLVGSWPADRILGYAGNDCLYGGGGDDFMDGGDGNDTIFGEGGADYLVGEGGNDSLSAGSGDDLLGGGSGNDTCAGAEGLDTIYGDAGNDCLKGGYNDDLYGGEGNDLILFDVESESTIAGVFGLADGGNGNDTISYGYGIDSPTFNGGAGIDTLRLHFLDVDHGIKGDLAKMMSNSIRPYHLLVVSGFEVLNVTGSRYNDNFTGGSLGDVISGSTGDDTLMGGDGPDTLSGGSGFNSVLGGQGDDSLYGETTGSETLAGGIGNDFYRLQSWSKSIIVEDLNSGIDTVATFGSYVLPTNVENLYLWIDAGLPGPFHYNGKGNILANQIHGNEDNNILEGLAGRDTLNGWDGVDRLLGANAVTLGKNEIDQLTGGPAADRFFLGLPTGRLYDNTISANPGLTDYALITDFTPTQLDKLQLKGTASQYFLGNSPLAGVPGQALYHDSNANGSLQTGTDELIAIIRSPSTLTVANTINTAIFV